MKKLVLLAVLVTVACKKKKAEDPPATGTASAAPVTVDAAAAPVAIDAADVPAVDAATAAAADAAPAPVVDKDTLCPQVLDKIALCKDDAGFKAALAEGADAAKQKEIDKLVKGITKWPKNVCTYDHEFEYPGFLDRWDAFAAPGVVDDCAKLGAAVRVSGGLFGGDIAK